MKPEDYEAKALRYLMKAANMIEFTHRLHKPEDQKRARKTAKLVKVIGQHYSEAVEKISEDEVKKEAERINNFIDLNTNKTKVQITKSYL